MKNLVIFINLIISIYLYAIAPEEYNLPYCIIALILFLITFAVVLVYRERKNYFTFEFIFSIVFFFVYYLYPVFGYLGNKYIYVFHFNANYITKCTLLATIGYIAFSLGLLNKSKIRIVLNKKKTITYIKSYNKNYYLVITFVAIVSCIITVMQMFVFHANRYSGIGDSGVWGYLKLLRGGATYACLTLIFYRIIYSTEKKSIVKQLIPYFIFLGIECVVMAISGYRAVPLGYILIVFSGIAIVKKKVSIGKMAILIFVGFLVLYMLMLFRADNMDKFQLNIFSITSDLITNNITSFLSYEYVKENGFAIFPLIGSLLMLVPFLLGTVVRLCAIPTQFVSSAELLTYMATGKIAAESVGLGTNIIASLYLSVGMIGIVMFMFCYGKLIDIISKGTINANLYKLFLYFEMMSVSVYQVRADFFYQIPFILWGYIFLKIILRMTCRVGKIYD